MLAFALDKVRQERNEKLKAAYEINKQISSGTGLTANELEDMARRRG